MRIPTESGHGFQSKADKDSKRIRTTIPTESGQRSNILEVGLGRERTKHHDPRSAYLLHVLESLQRTGPQLPRLKKREQSWNNEPICPFPWTKQRKKSLFRRQLTSSSLDQTFKKPGRITESRQIQYAPSVLSSTARGCLYRVAEASPLYFPIQVCRNR